MGELRDIPATHLDKYIEDQLLPDTHFRVQVNQAIDIMSSFLKERCFQRAAHSVRVLKVVKGGSSGKGTSLRGRSDADLVVFLSPLTSFQEQLQHRGEFVREIRRQLEACQREKKFDVVFEVQNPRWEKPRALSFMLRSPRIQEGVEFDVLPAFDVLGQLTSDYRPDPQIYIRLIQESQRLGRGGEFSTCFTELQRAFLKQRPTKVKSLIRLVKRWYQECKKKLGKPLPPQYALELLTIYAWEKGSMETEFITAQGFLTVLKLVLNYQQLCIYWTKYYTLEDPFIKRYVMAQLGKPRPVILDPADPTGNVAGAEPNSWPRLAQEARAWLNYPCFKKWDGSSVGSWDVQLRNNLCSIP
ncbi:2'-5'-oligoadenylate synthase-like protein [Manis pentadactyla]|uniref:2'-5'-oligoadenylate synthase 1-like n=1 Tax=Manis pentadactyla TaxID=143292 RepID=UPI00255CBC95|nr:2'-5'-oligoadenylate synthase 1-like [Manis pentadactyla]XP_057347826.1 2'-5'-oligoadenylate synthase-like protein [Manis pentadactyla]KAI5156082.1 2'-5'-Oligoadenylate Synthase 1 [Manis pentadactyla]